MIILDLYRKLEIKQRSLLLAAYIRLRHNSCYRANTDNKIQVALRNIRVPTLARKEKPSESQERSYIRNQVHTYSTISTRLALTKPKSKPQQNH